MSKPPIQITADDRQKLDKILSGDKTPVVKYKLLIAELIRISGVDTSRYCRIHSDSRMLKFNRWLSVESNDLPRKNEHENLVNAMLSSFSQHVDAANTQVDTYLFAKFKKDADELHKLTLESKRPSSKDIKPRMPKASPEENTHLSKRIQDFYDGVKDIFTQRQIDYGKATITNYSRRTSHLLKDYETDGNLIPRQNLANLLRALDNKGSSEDDLGKLYDLYKEAYRFRRSLTSGVPDIADEYQKLLFDFPPVAAKPISKGGRG